jgi:hypothetical protein
MKLADLYEGKSLPAAGSTALAAIWRALELAGYEQQDDADGSGIWRSVDVIDGQPVDFEYRYNPETSAWSFLAALQGQALQEITSNRGEDDLLRHLKRKHKVKASQL